MKLHVINSDSSGNGYILQNDETALIIEAGVKLKDLKVALGFNLAKVAGCIVTHIHGDHAKYIDDYRRAGIKVMHPDQMIDRNRFYLDAWKVIPYAVIHDTKTFCFVINHQETGWFNFVTDTHYLPYTFPGLNNWIIECNYDINIMDNHVLNGRLLPLVRNRVINSHLSLDTVLEIFAANDINRVNNIVLIHLSNGNSHARNFKLEVEQATGKNVHVAEPGLVIDFNKEF